LLLPSGIIPDSAEGCVILSHRIVWHWVLQIARQAETVSEPTSILLLGGSATELARLQRTLARHFLLVEAARDFREASDVARRCRFHVLVLVDPELSWTQLRAAWEECDGLPSTILLIVPVSRAPIAVAALRDGVTDVLLRPVSSDELVASVKALVGRGPAVRSEEQHAPAAAHPPAYPEEWTLEQVKDHHMARVLEASGGNKSAAARRLGISRKTLERKLGTGGNKQRRKP
jgi:DNA-binding NtrC family response regulator